MKISILNYHGFESQKGTYQALEEERPYLLSSQVFEKQLQEIQSQGFKTLNLSELKNSEKITERSLMITLDDGLKSQFEEAVPLLKSKNMKAHFFVTAEFVGREGFMNWEDLRALVRDGFEIGSHGLQHIALTGLPEKEICREFEESKKRLEEKLQVPIRSFSIPRGYYQPSMQEKAKKAGYEFLFTSSYDVNETPLDFYFLKRLVVKKATSSEQFSRLIKGELGFSRNWEKMKEGVRTHIPAEFYDGLAALKRRVRG